MLEFVEKGNQGGAREIPFRRGCLLITQALRPEQKTKKSFGSCSDVGAIGRQRDTCIARENEETPEKEEMLFTRLS